MNKAERRYFIPKTPPLPPAVLLSKVELSIAISLLSTANTPPFSAALLLQKVLFRTEIVAFLMESTPPL